VGGDEDIERFVRVIGRQEATDQAAIPGQTPPNFVEIRRGQLNESRMAPLMGVDAENRHVVLASDGLVAAADNRVNRTG
jgi:hypothetical protein